MRANIILATAAIVTAAAPALAATPSEDEFSWTGTVAAGQAIEIKNFNGPVHAEGTDTDRVEVTAVKEGPAKEREEVAFELVEHDGGVTICALFPGHGNRCAPDEEGSLGRADNHTRVSFNVRVPAGVLLTVRTMNGGIEAEQLRSGATLLTMNGAIEASSSGWIRARTMNGRIDCRIGRTDWQGTLELETMNGAVHVTLPAAADVEVDAQTMNGRIESDWPLDSSGWLGKRAQGRIGEGGRTLKLRSMNGRILLRRGA